MLRCFLVSDLILEYVDTIIDIIKSQSVVNHLLHPVKNQALIRSGRQELKDINKHTFEQVITNTCLYFRSRSKHNIKHLSHSRFHELP